MSDSRRPEVSPLDVSINALYIIPIVININISIAQSDCVYKLRV